MLHPQGEHRGPHASLLGRLCQPADWRRRAGLPAGVCLLARFCLSHRAPGPLQSLCGEGRSQQPVRGPAPMSARYMLRTGSLTPMRLGSLSHPAPSLPPGCTPCPALPAPLGKVRPRPPLPTSSPLPQGTALPSSCGTGPCFLGVRGTVHLHEPNGWRALRDPCPCPPGPQPARGASGPAVATAVPPCLCTLPRESPMWRPSLRESWGQAGVLRHPQRLPRRLGEKDQGHGLGSIW